MALAICCIAWALGEDWSGERINKIICEKEKKEKREGGGGESPAITSCCTYIIVVNRLTTTNGPPIFSMRFFSACNLFPHTLQQTIVLRSCQHYATRRVPWI
jgi:hypothetical protein